MAVCAVFPPLLAFCALCCLGAQADFCFHYDSFSGSYVHEDCKDTGCCGKYPDESCCDEEIFMVGVIVGIVAGGIMVIAIIIALVCCCTKTKGQSGRTVQPEGRPHVTIIYTGRRSAGGPSAPPYPPNKPVDYPPPPPYSAPGYPPPGPSNP